MIELLISEITHMNSGSCVLGLEARNPGFRSLRPIPLTSSAWPAFPYRRADKVAFQLSMMPVIEPHVEDRVVTSHRKLSAVPENELVHCLKQAEVANSIKDLFGCQLQQSRLGSDAVFVNPADAGRSICGCEVDGINFSFKFYPKIRASLVLASKETIRSLPVVDRDLIDFVEQLDRKIGSPADLRYRLERFFNSVYKSKVMSSPIKFARIGLTRPYKGDSCWLMLDSLFPLPRCEWQEEFK